MAKKCASMWRCSCAVTMREIRARINCAREIEGKRPLTWMRMYQLRLLLAEEWLASALKKRSNPVRNPYLPDRLIGPSYIFKVRKANRLFKAGVALEVRNPGRQPGSKFVRGKYVPAPVAC